MVAVPLFFRAVGGATTLALARVLALAAVVARTAAALAFAGIEAFASVLFHFVVRGLPGNRADGGTAGVRRSGRAGQSAAQQAGEGRREYHGTFRKFHNFN